MGVSMFEKLLELRNNSYSKLSGYKVACIIKMNDDKEYNGVNIENPSFKDGMCAEQVAIGSAISDGYKKGDIKEMYLLGSSNKSITPCFLCRQLITEFMTNDTSIITYDKTGKETKYKVSELCSNAFGSDDLNDK